MTFNLLIPARKKKKKHIARTLLFTVNIRCLCSSKTTLKKSVQVTLFFSESWRWMDRCDSSCCHDHQQQQQQQQRYRHRLPAGDSALPKQISSSKNCWGPNPLITSTWNQIIVPESAARWNWCTWNKPRSSSILLLLLLLFLHHQFGTFISGYSLPGEMGEKCQDKGDMAYPPSLAFSLLVLSLPPFFFLLLLVLLLIHSPATLSLFSFYPVIYIVRSVFLPPSLGCVKQEQVEMRSRGAVLGIAKHRKRWILTVLPPREQNETSPAALRNRLLAFKNKNDLNFPSFRDRCDLHGCRRWHRNQTCTQMCFFLKQ